MPNRTARTLLFATLLAALLAACEGDGGDGPAADAATDVVGTEDGTAPADAGGAPDSTAPADTGAGADTRADTAAPPLPLTDRVLNIAHRGGASLAPEHTLLAYETGLAAGADMLELDLHATSDGVLVLCHDDKVDRTTDGTGTIKDMTLAELRTLDAGYRFTTDGGETYPYRGEGLVIPTFDEVLAAFPDVWMTIEPKQGDPSILVPLLDALREADALDRSVIGAIEGVKLQEIREREPDVLTGFGAEEIVAFVALTEAAEADYEPPGEVMQFPDTAVTVERVERAHRFGIKMHVWTVNDRAEMERFLDMGVDGIITDDPALLEEVLVERGLR